MPPAGYPAFLQYLQSGRVREILAALRAVNTMKQSRPGGIRV